MSTMCREQVSDKLRRLWMTTIDVIQQLDHGQNLLL